MVLRVMFSLPGPLNSLDLTHDFIISSLLFDDDAVKVMLRSVLSYNPCPIPPGRQTADHLYDGV